MNKITITKSKDNARIDFTVYGKEYHTNNSGLGLWIGDDYTKQILGTMQFQLTQQTISGIRKAIEKTFSEDIKEYEYWEVKR